MWNVYGKTRKKTENLLDYLKETTGFWKLKDVHRTAFCEEFALEEATDLKQVRHNL
jgi:hypothetical protein